MNTYTHFVDSPLKEQLSIGVVSQTYDLYCESLTKGVSEALGKYSTNVLTLNNLSKHDNVDVIAKMSIISDYKGSLLQGFFF